MKTLAHFGQEIGRGGNFRMFDFGTSGNLLRYNVEKPMEYDLRKIKLPCYIFYGEVDMLSDPEVYFIIKL